MGHRTCYPDRGRDLLGMAKVARATTQHTLEGTIYSDLHCGDGSYGARLHEDSTVKPAWVAAVVTISREYMKRFGHSRSQSFEHFFFKYDRCLFSKCIECEVPIFVGSGLLS